MAWGAVGFRNSATDSNEDKRWVKKKFEDDLVAAKRDGVNVSVFVFFTNIDLTPSEQKELQLIGKQQGFSQIDLFYRERLRIILDSPGGLGFRFQYLDINLTNAEQASFFDRFGADLERSIVQGFATVDKKLARLEFFHDCTKLLVDLRLIVILAEPVSPADLGHFRVLIDITDFSDTTSPHPSVSLAVRDAYGILHRGTEEHLIPGVKTIAWARNPDAEIQNTVIGSTGVGQLHQIVAQTGVHKQGPFQSLGDLDRKDFTLYMTEQLFARIAIIGLIANGYWIVRLPKDAFVGRGDVLPEWPEELNTNERVVNWVRLALPAGNPGGPPLERRFSPDFSGYTPQKVDQIQSP